MEQADPSAKIFISRRHLTSFVAKHRRRKRCTRGFQAIPLEDDLGLGALGAFGAIQADITLDQAANEFFAFSIDLMVTTRDATVNEGPVGVYIMHNGYSTTEFEQWKELAQGFQRGNLQAQEVAKRGRMIKRIGSFPLASVQESLNDGRPFRTKLGFVIAEGNTLALVGYNTSGIAPLTTGCVVHVSGTLYGRWI